MKRKNEAKQIETKRKLIFLVSRNEAKRFPFRFEAKKKYKRKWDTLVGTNEENFIENFVCFS